MEATEVRAIHKYARISDQKAREVTRAITGMPVSQAINVLNFTPKKAAYLVGKVLRSAVANAENVHELDADELYVKSAQALKGPILHRIMPRARGSAAPIKKRMAHILVVLAPKQDEEESKPKKTRAAKAEGKTEAAAESKPKAKTARRSTKK